MLFSSAPLALVEPTGERVVSKERQKYILALAVRLFVAALVACLNRHQHVYRSCDKHFIRVQVTFVLQILYCARLFFCKINLQNVSRDIFAPRAVLIAFVPQSLAALRICLSCVEEAPVHYTVDSPTETKTSLVTMATHHFKWYLVIAVSYNTKHLAMF